MNLRPLALLLVLSAPADAARQVQVTFYVPTPHTPACGPQRPSTRQLAVSRDLRRLYPCGTRLALTLPGRRVITGTVTTGPAARQTVDVPVRSRAQAVRSGRIPAKLRRLP